MHYLIKYAGILTITVCLSVLGFLKARLKSEHIKNLEEINLALSRADDMLMLGTKGRREIISECFSSLDGFILTPRAAFKDKAAGRFTAALNGFLSEFGSGDKVIERGRIRRVKRELSAIISDEKQTCAKYSKIWQTAGVCAGLAAGIMFI